MTAACYQFDDGHSNPTKCFPPRTLQRRRKEGAGHWLVAYRKAEKQKYKNMHRRIKETYNESENNTGSDSPRGNTLDRPFLLQLHCVDKPSELCSVDVSEQNLDSVKPEDLKMFDNVAHINASINSLSLGSFSSFVSLRELDLSLNWLCNMTFNAADFPHLEVLDLSYNSLSADDIFSIGRLPRLKVLHLTGNELHRLPPDLSASSHDHTQLPATEEDTKFKALEVLMLDDNRLSSGVFHSLANLKRLKYLNLQGNRVSKIPFLQVTDFSDHLKTPIEEQAEEDAHTELNPNADENFRRIMQISHWDEHCETPTFPLPELQFLNLADNKIAEEESLMAAAFFPMLHEIDIHSNPLTTQRSGDPPLLTNYLKERLGITIKRKKTQEVMKVPLTVSTNPKWKLSDFSGNRVESGTLKLPDSIDKNSNFTTQNSGVAGLLLLRSVEKRIPKKPMLMDARCQTVVEKCEVPVERTPESVGEKSRDDTRQENTERFFVTQATDVPEYEFDLQADEKETRENKDDIITETFPCYKPAPDVVEPIGIQTTVRMLEHTLKNLNVYRDSKPKLDSIQTPCREREKRIKELPPLKTRKQPAERVDEVFKEIKKSTTIKKVPLSRAIHGKGVNKQERKEALSLLRDLKTKHKMVHKKTMEQAASMESGGNTNQACRCGM